MSPAAHALTGALIAERTRPLGVALGLAAASHLALDFIFHFEAFYPLSRVLGVSHHEAWALTALAAAGVFAPLAAWIGRSDPPKLWFALYAAAMCGMLAMGDWAGRLGYTLAATLAFALLTRDPRSLRWALGAFCANLLDCVKLPLPALENVHEAAHYDGLRDLGYWLQRWFSPGPGIAIPFRFEDPWYILGYVLELAIEGGLALAAFYLLGRAGSGSAHSASSP
jgi:hypothetical protein